MSRADKQRRRAKRKEKRERKWDRSGGGLIAVLSEYRVTREPLTGRDPGVRDAADVLSEDDHRRIYESVHADPEAAIPELERLVERHPDVPAFYNWLTAAYGLVGRMADAKRIAALNYERNPRYLFARINQAQMLLEDGKLEEAAKLAAHFRPQVIYPHRTLFHVTEITAIGAVAVEYYARTRDFDAAESWLETLEAIGADPGQLVMLRMQLGHAKAPGGLMGRMLELLKGRKSSS